MNRKDCRKKTLKFVLPIALAISILVFLATGMSMAGDSGYEGPAVLKAGNFLSEDEMSGPNHKVDEKVNNDGFVNRYTIRSRFGFFEAASTFLLKKRIHEINAIAEMEKIRTSDKVIAGLGDSGRRSVAGMRNLVTDPGNTLSGAGEGIGNMFGRARDSLQNRQSQTEDSRVESIIGLANTKREVAARFGVDVYSANQPLQEQLDRLARAYYVGGLGVRAGLSVIPGGVGLAVSALGATRVLNEQINTTAPSELRRQNREKLLGMGMNPDTVELFINNTAFSPRQRTWLVAALEKMKGASNRELFLKVGLQVNNRAMALVVTRMTVLYAGYHQKIAPIATFHPVARVLYARNQKGEIQLVLPADHITWNDRFAGGVADINSKRKDKKVAALWTTGGVSETAKDRLSRAGWTIHTHVTPKLDDTAG